jgi:hypothetical protein
MIPYGHDLSCLSAPSVVGCLDRLVGEVFHVTRAGQAHSFTLEFQEFGRLIVNFQGQVVEELWQPSPFCPSSVILGGQRMPKAEVIIGSQLCCGEQVEMWETSPPNGAAPLMGKRQHKIDPADGLHRGVATKLELIVDRSGSMQPLHAATVQGLNRFLSEQRCSPHAQTMTMRLVVFDDRIEMPWPETTPLSDSTLTVTPEMVQPRGQTALLDAIGVTLDGTPLSPPRVVCIVTDGKENASRRYQRNRVNELISERKNAGWTFIFLAANQDAIAEGTNLGIDTGNCSTFSASPEGIAGCFGSASAASCRGSLFGSAAAAFSASERAACLAVKL